MSLTRNVLLSAPLLVALGAGCTCGTFDPTTTRFACTTSADCSEGSTCQTVGDAKECVAGTGVPPGQNGAGCTAPGECGSGFCVGGLCCESRCGAECESCAVAGARGRCLPSASGTACGTNYRCDGSTGTCPTSCTDAAQCAPARDCVLSACVDLDECSASGLCGSNTVCTNTPGAWQCSCADGFAGPTTTGAPATCVDVDECLAGTDCGPLAVCENTPGSWKCSCPAGTFGATVSGGPTSCSTIDRCTSAGMCGANADCASTSTSYSCTCQQGYVGVTTLGAPAVCAEANECNTPGVCGSNANCANTVGSFKCTCAVGFTGATTTGTAATCTDVDECPTLVTCGANARCTNTPGSWTCACDAGFMGAAVTGGPATCTVIDRCAGVSCGANATCASDPNGYVCSCASGYQGTPVNGGPATCADRDECATPAACGANANCANTQGSYTCTCAAGFTGTMTTGTPATCVSGPMPLGTAQGTTPLSITLTQGLPAGTRVALAYGAGSTNTQVTDSKGNTWVRLVNDQSCGACGSAGLFFSTLTNPWVVGDTVTFGPSGMIAAAWLTSLNGYGFVDQLGTYGANGSSSAPFVSTPSPVLDPDELRIAAFATRTAASLATAPDGGFTSQLTFTDPALSGIIASSMTSGLSGVQTFTATALPAERFSGFIATFYGGAQVAPTGLSLAHSANSRGFTVSWTAGRGNGGATGCAVQYQSFAGTWTTLLSTNCDTGALARAVNLPAAANWYGGAWSSVQVRLLRLSDAVVLGTFTTNLTCGPRGASTSPTPSLDENCDSTWDDHTCSSYGWVAGTVYSATFTACTNSGDVTATKVCSVGNEAESRYTDGMGTVLSPAVAWSSSSFGSACTGSYTGATTWSCAGSGCSYR